MQNDSAKFENEFYRRLIKFSLEIIKFCNQVRRDRNLWSIADQLIRSATSIGQMLLRLNLVDRKKII